MSQAAVSAALARLRRAYGDQLFTRGPGGMEPTVRAERMYTPVLSALRVLETAIGGEQAFDPVRDEFDLRMGMSDDLEILFVPRILSDVMSRNPGLSLFGVQSTRLLMARQLEGGQIDLGIAASSVWGSQFRYRVLFESGYACLFDPRHVAGGSGLGLEEYLALPHVMISHDGTRGIVDDVLEALGHTRHRLLSTSHFAMVPFLLTRAAIVATMPRHAAEVYAREFELEYCDPPIELPSFAVSAVWHQSRDADPRVRWMVQTLATLAQN